MLSDGLLDCDGVLSDFQATSLRDLNSDLKPEDVTKFDLLSVLSEGEKAGALELWNDDDWWYELPPIEGAKEGVDRLRSMGYGIVVVSAPWASCKNWEYARRAWLKKHFGVGSSHVLLGARKQLVAGAFLIEDKPENLCTWAANWEKLGAKPIVFDQPYNRSHPDPEIQKSLDTFKRLKGWRSLTTI